LKTIKYTDDDDGGNMFSLYMHEEEKSNENHNLFFSYNSSLYIPHEIIVKL